MRVGLVGTFDIENFGDCLFPEVYASELSRRLPNATFEVLSPTSRVASIASFDSVAPLPTSLEHLAALSCDAYILIGGETLSFGHNVGNYISRRSSMSAALRLWLPELLAASQPSGPPFFIHSAGIPSTISDADGLVAFPLMSRANGVSLRDKYSLERFEAGGGVATLRVDPVFGVSGLEHHTQWQQRAERFIPDGWMSSGYLVAQVSYPYIGRSVEDWCVAIASIARDNDWPVALLPLCHFLHDPIVLRSAKRFLAKLGVKAHLITGKLNVRDSVGVIAGSSAYCGSSLHGAVVAASFAKPIAVLANGPRSKHAGVLESVGLEGVTTDSVDELAMCMKRSVQYDLEDVRKNATSMAAVGLDELSKEVLVQSIKARGISKESLDRLIALDRAPTAGIQNFLKRPILKATKNSRLFGAMYYSAMRYVRRRPR